MYKVRCKECEGTGKISAAQARLLLAQPSEPASKPADRAQNIMETRAQHLQECKERALKELDFYPDVRQACRNALASMGSDLNKHPETADHAGIKLGFMMLMADQREAHDKEAMRKFILGFH